jgi:PAS domain S-box-containing protein
MNKETGPEGLLTVAPVATLLLDNNLQVERYTAGIDALFDAAPEDGELLAGVLRRRLGYDDLEGDAQRVLRSGQPVEREVRSDDERWFFLRLAAYRTPGGEIDGVALTLFETTTFRKTRQALRQSREEYRLMVESTREYAMFTMDPDGIIRNWNQGARRILGWDEEEVVGQPGSIIFTPEDLAARAPERELRTAREEGQAMDERWHLRKDGSRFWGSGVVTSLWDNGMLRGYAKVMRDNTARKAAREALEQREQELARLNETLEEQVEERTEQVRQLASELTLAEQAERQRLSQVLHDDLQQRLFAIQMQLTLLLQAAEQADQKAVREEFRQVKSALDEAIGVTRRLSADLSPPVLHDEGMAQALKWLSQQMKEQYDLEVLVEAEAPFPIPDEKVRILLFQMVRELLFNVVKHAGVSQAVVRLHGVDREDQIQIQVSDEGIGFDPAVPTSDHRSHGLVSIRQRLNLLGGTVKIQSRPAEGTTVTVIAPVTASR